MFEDIVLFIFAIFWLGLTVMFGYAGFLLINEGAEGTGVLLLFVALLTFALSRK